MSTYNILTNINKLVYISLLLAPLTIYSQSRPNKWNVDWENPVGVAVDSSGNIFVTDERSNCVYKLGIEGSFSIFSGHKGKSGHLDGNKYSALFRTPCGIAIDSKNNLYITDSSNHCIRKITPHGEVTTIAGKPGQDGYLDGMGSSALFRYPLGIAVDKSDVIYIADQHNFSIRKIDKSGIVSTLKRMKLPWISQITEYGPSDIAIDGNGIVYFIDSGFHFIGRYQTSGYPVLFAGNKLGGVLQDGPAEKASFSSPTGMVITIEGEIFVADTHNNAIRMVSKNGHVTTLAGGGFGDKDGSGNRAEFRNPRDIAINKDGNLIVCDSGNRSLRLINENGLVSTITKLILNK